MAQDPLSRGLREGRPAKAGRPRALLPGLGVLIAAIVTSGVLAFLLIGDPGVQASPGAARVDVTLDEWTLTGEQQTIEAGPVSFIAANDGQAEHELLVIKTSFAADELPQGIYGPDPKLAGKLVVGKRHQHISTNDTYAVLGRPDDANTKSHIGPGEERVFEADLAPGSYVMYCSLPGHYQRGQHAALSVTKTNQSGGSE